MVAGGEIGVFLFGALLELHIDFGWEGFVLRVELAFNTLEVPYDVLSLRRQREDAGAFRDSLLERGPGL